MSISSLYHDPTVPANIIERYKLAYLMQFFVQHKQRFKFPRVRLQDLYKLLETPDTRALSYLIVQILRFLKVPNATISTVDKALDIFTCEKRTSTRVGTHQLRANRQISELGAENKAKLLENLIETVYDELPDFNFAPNGFNSGNNSSSANSHPFGGGNKSMNDIKQEESVDDSMNELAIKAGSDSRGSSYVYLDDLRLYREKPQSSLSTQWDVVVGPTIDQWHNFIRSLGNNDEEGDLKAFLKDHLLEIVCTSLDSGELMQDNPELNISYLLSREQAEINGPLEYYSLGQNQSSSCSNKLYDINDSGGGGGSGGSSGEMACLDPSVAGISIKQEMPETPESYSGPYMNTGMMPQNQQMIPRSNSYPGSQIPMASPLYGSVSSPTQSVHGGPLTPSGDNILNKTSPRISSGQSREQRVDNSNMPMSYSQSQQNLYHQTQSQHVQDPMVNGHIRYQAPHRFPCPSNGSMVMIGNNPNISQAGTPQVMVFTTQMANDAALEHTRHRTPLYQFHNNHPAVSDFIQLQCNPSRMMSLQKPFENLTQKQLENRKNKMAKLEQIQSTLSKTKSQNTANPSNITQTSSVSTAASGVTHDLHQGPPSAGHMLSSGGAEPGHQGPEHSLQDLGQPMTNPATPMLSEGPCQFPNDQPLQGQYHFNPNSQMSSIEQQMMVENSNNPPTSEAALRQWELLRLEYMREKQTHDVMSNRFQAVDIGPYSNGSGSGSQAIMPTNMPVGSSMMAGHRPNVIRQPFPPHNLPMEQPPGVMYPAGAPAGVKRPYQLIGAPPPPGYHTNPLYHHHHDSIMNQRALLMQQQQQQPRGPPICDPSWNMVHQNYPHMVPNHHPMHQNFANMYPNHRGPTPPVALGINNGPLSSGQNVSSNSSTTTTTSTSSKSKSKKRKSTAKSSSSVANSSTSTTTTTSTTMSSASVPHCSADVKPQPAAPSMTSEAQNQRFVTPMMGLGSHDDQNATSRSIPNFQDSSMNGPVASRTPLPENQTLSNSAQVKHDLISPHKSSFSPHSDMKSTGSLNSSNHMNSLSMSSNNNFPSNSSNLITAYCSSSTSSPSQNLTSASLASLARLSSQMSGGSDSPLFNSLQSQPTTHSSSSSNSLSSKMGSNNLIHSIQPQQIQDSQMSLHQMPQQPGNGPYSSQYAQYRHMSNPMLTQTQQQQQFQHNTVIQSHEGQNRPLKSNQSSTMNIQPSATANNFVPGHPVQVQMPQSAHPSFQGSNDAMFSSYQSYPSQQQPMNTSNPGTNPSNSPANSNTNLVPGVPVQNGPQQPPSIMVNNTFVNAQLNVQQMNYQHLAAPNVNAQMQIQQQHQSIQPPALMNLETNSKHSSEMSNLGTPISISQSNTSIEPNLNQAASMGLGSNSDNVPQSGNSGYMNSSLVQIQSKTPHTIQYLPAEPVIGAPQGASGTHQGDISGCQSKYSSITAQPLELDELLSTQNKQMMFQPHNHDLSTGVMSNVHSNNIMMMGQQQMESQQYRFQQHQQQIRLRAAPPQGTMIMRQSQQQQQHLVLQQSFPGGNGGAMLDQQMKQQQIQRFMMVNNNQLCQQQQQQQQQQHMMMSGQLPGGNHSHYMAMESASSQEQQHLYHQQQFIAIQQQQQQQIRQQTQGHHFG